MKYSRTILIISSFAVAIASGISFPVMQARAAESLPSFINTASAKETTPDVLTTEERIAILKEIITASQDEIVSFTDKLKDLELDKQWGFARDHFVETLATSSAYYTALSDRIDQKDISLDEVKAIAKDLKDWREAIYGPDMKEIGNLILVFQTEDVRTIVESRGAKISSDVKKLDRQKLVNTDTLKKYLSQAEKSIKNARLLNDKAKDLYFSVSVSPLQPQDEIKPSEEQIENSAPIVEKDTKDQPIIKTMAERQDEVRELSKDSLKELKTAYELFFKMNDRIRK